MPWPSALVTWQPSGQGHRLHVTVVARDQLAEVHRAARREFAAWRAEPFSRGAHQTDCRRV